MGELSYTTGGDSNLVRFRSAARVPITSLKAEFKPKQDFNGYSKPWIGGTGKNLLKNQRKSGSLTVFNSIFTTNEDGSITITGNPESGSGLIINNSLTLSPGTYILSGCPSNGSENTFKLNLYNNLIVNDYGNGATFTLTEETTCKARIFWQAGAALNGTTFYPMIRLASNNDATWEPYENICPIEGQQGVEAYQDSVYLPKEYQRVQWIKSDGNQYIDTGILFNHGIKITAKMGFVEKVNSKTLFGIRLSTGAERFLVTYYEGLDFAYWGDESWKEPGIDQIYKIIFDTTIPNTLIYGIGNSLKTKSVTEMYSNITGYIFAYHRKNDDSIQQMSKSYFESMIIENASGQKLFEGYACYRKSDNVIGIYDKVTGNLFTNQGTGSFVCGPDCGETISVEFPAVGKNLLNKEKYSAIVDKAIVFGGSFSSSKPDGSFILDAGTYTLSIDTAVDAISVVGSNGSIIHNVTSNVTENTFTIDSKQAVRILILHNNADSAETLLSYNYQLESGDTATTYEPFNNTVYGGYIDIAKGELIVTKYKVIIDGSYPFEYANRNAVSRFRTYLSNLGPVPLNNVDFLSDKLTLDRGSLNNTPWTIWLVANSYYVEITMPASYTTAEAFSTYFSENPVTLVYNINPVTYQLSPIQLQTLLDQNNIWSNTNGNTEVSYAIHDSAMIRATKQQILAAAQPRLLTSSGSFQTNFPASLQSAKIYFNPIQKGSGDPSPENVRPITGWTGLSVYHSGENLYVPNAENQGYINKSGVINVDTTSTYTDLIPVNPGETYSFRCTTVSVNGETNRRIHGYDSNGDWVQQIARGTTAPDTVEDRKILATIPSGIAYIRVSFRNQDTNVRIAKENVYEIDWENNIGTIYGGYVDLISGQLIQTWFGTAINRNTIPNMKKDSVNTEKGYIQGYFINSRHGIPKMKSYQGVSNRFKCMTSAKSEPNSFITFATNTYFMLPLEEVVTQDAAGILDWFDEHPTFWAAEMDTPITHQLSPQTLKTLRGTNNIWSNANGPIEVKYWTH